MILLNGVPPIIGIGLLHVTIINVAAIFIEYYFIKRHHEINKLFLRTILSNVTSLAVGLIVLVMIPDYLGGNIMHTDTPMTNLDKASLIAGLCGLFIANVAFEFPAYIIGSKTNKPTMIKLFKTVLFANLLTNIPVFILYGTLTI